MFSLEQYFKERRALIDRALDERMPLATTRPTVLHEAMRYSVFSGGKRLRPVLCLAACEAVGGNVQDALIPACAIELLHTYTLIHDDLPAMDNDKLRRGKPTCHVKFGEANAILAGDALLTMAFAWLADTPLLAKELAQAAGSEGVVGGQVEDLAAEGQTPDEETLLYIHRNKTAKLFRAAARIGGFAGNATEEQLQALTSYGEYFGLAFQLVDDLLDEKQDKQMTAIDVWGTEGTRERAQRNIESAQQAVSIFGERAQPLKELSLFVPQQVH